MAAGASPVAVPTMDNGLLRLMLQGRSGTQVCVKKRILGEFTASRGGDGVLVWEGVMKLRIISVYPY